ncbi:uncharacterized protein EV154DRAFT_555916, partial [Mucor mucedo]|uniref:uncharacterized protein n=1 Tax=Mucor mucedo TaxID=29922 RepID=UPI00221F6D01
MLIRDMLSSIWQEEENTMVHLSINAKSRVKGLLLTYVTINIRRIFWTSFSKHSTLITTPVRSHRTVDVRIAEGESLIVPKRVEVAPRNPLIEILFIKLNQSKNEVSLEEVDVKDVDDTLIKDKLTCGKCHKTFNSRSSLIKHLKVKHHVVIVG